MNLGNRMPAALVAVTVTLFAVGCQTDVPKNKMDEISAWSIAVCACAQKPVAEGKACAAKLKRPELDRLTSGGRPKYKLESVKLYGEIETRGEMCMVKFL